MKVNCKALKISIWISSISLALSVIFRIVYFNIHNNIMEFLQEIVLGVFCSSIITVFFYTSAYKVEKKRLLERYWSEVRKLLIELDKIEYMNIEYSEEIIINYIHEKSYSWIKEYNKLNPKNQIEENLTNTNLLKSAIEEENKDAINQLTEKAKEKFLDRRLENIYQKTIEKINKIIDQYMEFLKFGTENLNFMLGDMEFFSGITNYKEAHELFQAIYDLRIKIQESARHFRYYKDGEGNKSVVLSEILQLQKNIFRTDERDTENQNIKIVYNEFNDKMNNKLERFRAEIIYNIKPEYYEEIPKLEIVRNKKCEI